VAPLPNISDNPVVRIQEEICMAAAAMADNLGVTFLRGPEQLYLSDLLFHLMAIPLSPSFISGHLLWHWRILLPYFSTLDLLRLSECSQGLLKYRSHITRVTIVPHPSPTAGMKRALVRLLAEQQTGVHYLRIGDRTVVSVLDLVAWG
jgi:hypothetical protein